MILFLLQLLIAQAFACPHDRVVRTQQGEFLLYVYMPEGSNPCFETIYKIESDRLRHLRTPIQEYGTQIHMILMSFPQIQRQRVTIASWKILSERTGYNLYFTFVFHMGSSTPNDPVYQLESKSYSGAIGNHEAAEEWAVNHIRAVSPHQSYHSPKRIRLDQMEEVKIPSPHLSRFSSRRPSPLSISVYQSFEDADNDIANQLYEPLLRSESEPSSSDFPVHHTEESD